MTFLILQWAGVMAVALYALIKGADLFIDGAKKVGIHFGMSAFAVGVLIVGMGTSLPELTSSLFAALTGVSDVVVANVVGSNITNILLITGVMGFFGGRIIIKQDLLRTELPIFVIATAHFSFTILDGIIDRVEAGLLLATFGAYLWYIIVESKSAEDANEDTLKSPNFPWRSLGLTIVGLMALIVGAKYTVDMAVNIATAMQVPLALISITAIAIGTSLPELTVTIKAIISKQTELGIGNIFGSNTFNVLVVGGLPSILVPQSVDVIVMDLGLGVMIVASIFLFVVGISRQMMRWEGLAMLIFFAFFMVKLVEMI